MLASALKVHRFHYLIDIITVVVTITATVVVHRNTFRDVINPHLPSSDCIFHHHLQNEGRSSSNQHICCFLHPHDRQINSSWHTGHSYQQASLYGQNSSSKTAPAHSAKLFSASSLQVVSTSYSLNSAAAGLNVIKVNLRGSLGFASNLKSFLAFLHSSLKSLCLSREHKESRAAFLQWANAFIAHFHLEFCTRSARVASCEETFYSENFHQRGQRAFRS